MSASGCPRCGTGYDSEVVALAGGTVCPRCVYESFAAAPTQLGGESDGGAPPELPSFPNYEILGVIGTGGMGVVYKARQAGLDRVVALKVLRPNVAEDPEAVERFMNEARSAARLQHPHVVPIHEVAAHEGRTYFSMDYIEGQSLADWLRHESRTFRDFAEAMRKVARAIHQAHQMGIVHRDLKPANVLVDRQGEPRVTDFGIAKDVRSPSAMTREGVSIGTPAYMAPEQASGESAKIGPLCDVYSLGAVLYECLTGRPPFDAETITQTLRRVLASPPAAPRTHRPDVPRELEAITLKALEKDPSRRYPSALAFAEDLERYLAGRDVLARRRSRLAGVLTAVVTVAAVAVTIRLYVRPPEGPPRLVDRLKSPDAEQRWTAAEELGRQGIQSAIPALRQALKDESPDVRRGAAEALAELEAREAVPDLVELLKDSNSGVRRRAGKLLAKLRAKEAVPALAALAERGEKTTVREVAADTLGKLRAVQAVPLLIRLLKDEDTDVREAALGALVEIGAAEAIPPILELLRDEDPLLRERAAAALGALKAVEAADALRKLSREDASEAVRKSAASALEELGPP